jgi:hypothetical protein
MTPVVDEDLAQPLHHAEPDAHRRHAVVLIGLSSGTATGCAPGGSIEIGLPLALIGLVISFGARKWLSRNWRTPPGPMKRFYKEAAARAVRRRLEILLDERPVKTPGRQPARCCRPRRSPRRSRRNGTRQGEKIDPRSMPLTGLANAAIDRVAPDPEAFARGLAAMARATSSATAPRAAPLVARQAEHGTRCSPGRGTASTSISRS